MSVFGLKLCPLPSGCHWYVSAQSWAGWYQWFPCQQKTELYMEPCDCSAWGSQPQEGGSCAVAPKNLSWFSDNTEIISVLCQLHLQVKSQRIIFGQLGKEQWPCWYLSLQFSLRKAFSQRHLFTSPLGMEPVTLKWSVVPWLWGHLWHVFIDPNCTPDVKGLLSSLSKYSISNGSREAAIKPLRRGNDSQL